MRVKVFTGLPPFCNILAAFLLPLVVDRGQRPQRPEDDTVRDRGLDSTTWTLIEESWNQEPSLRPTAAAIASRLNDRNLRGGKPPLQGSSSPKPLIELHESTTEGKLDNIFEQMHLGESTKDVSTDSGYMSGSHLSPEVLNSLETRDATQPVTRDISTFLQCEGELKQKAFRQHGDIRALDGAIQSYRQALLKRPTGSPRRDCSLHILGLALHDRFKQFGNMSALGEGLQRHRQALQLRPAGHPARDETLHALAVALRDRFQKCGNITMLEEAIELHREALDLRVRGSRRRHYSLNDIGMALCDRHHASGDANNLDEAVYRYREALSLRPPGHPWRCAARFV